MADFFSQLVYACANEDTQAELDALHPGPSDTVLCITGSGARPLDLLIAQPGAVVSVDLNPVQNRLLSLKMAAIRTLSYQDFGRLMGFLPSHPSRRFAYFQQVKPALSPEDALYWDKNGAQVSAGILYTGKWERYIRGIALAGLTRQRTLRQLMAAPDVTTQYEIWKKSWDNGLWRAYLRTVCSTWFWRNIIREPGAALIAPETDPAAYMAACLDRMMQTRLLRSSFFATMMFTGRMDPAGDLPLHLQESHYETLRAGLDRVEIITADLSAYLHQTERRFEAYSLSDFSSYTPMPTYAHTWEGVMRTASPGARVCERFFLVRPSYEPEGLIRDTTAETRIAGYEKTGIYTFRIGSVRSLT
ncbi:MAG: DUF3419 family protein [Bacteroidia bacterium]|nr:DUF3419 family protein [Bacteroidia bacterium]